MNIKKTIIIVIISVIISVSLSLLGVKIYNSVNHKKYTNLISEAGLYRVDSVEYKLPEFAIKFDGIYNEVVTNESISSLPVYEIDAVMNDGIYKDYYRYHGIRLKELLNLYEIKDYNNITFRSEGRLQVTFLKEEINDEVFLIFDVDGFQFEEDDPVGLLAVDYNLRYSITDVVSLMFD